MTVERGRGVGRGIGVRVDGSAGVRPRRATCARTATARRSASRGRRPGRRPRFGQVQRFELNGRVRCLQRRASGAAGAGAAGVRALRHRGSVERLARRRGRRRGCSARPRPAASRNSRRACRARSGPRRAGWGFARRPSTAVRAGGAVGRRRVAICVVAQGSPSGPAAVPGPSLNGPSLRKAWTRTASAPRPRRPRAGSSSPRRRARNCSWSCRPGSPRRSGRGRPPGGRPRRESARPKTAACCGSRCRTPCRRTGGPRSGRRGKSRSSRGRWRPSDRTGRAADQRRFIGADGLAPVDEDPVDISSAAGDSPNTVVTGGVARR